MNLTENDQTIPNEPLGKARRHGGATLLKMHRPRRGNAPLQLDQILQGNRNAVERTETTACKQRLVGGFGSQQSLLGIDFHVRMENSVILRDTRQKRFDEIARRNFPVRQFFGQDRYGKKAQFAVGSRNTLVHLFRLVIIK